MLSHGFFLNVIGSRSLALIQISSLLSNTQVITSGKPNQSARSYRNSPLAFLTSLVLTFDKATPVTFRTIGSPLWMAFFCGELAIDFITVTMPGKQSTNS